MKKKDIINDIEGKVANYFVWTIGITDDTNKRKKEYESRGEVIRFWEQWEADSEQDGRDIEKYFLEKGMKGGAGGNTSAKFIYVF